MKGVGRGAAQAGEQIATLELTESDRDAAITLTVQFPSKEASDAAIEAGIEQGAAAGYDRLDALLTSM